MTEAGDQVTHDTLLRGRIKLIQPARGLRVSLDPVLLAGFVRPPYGRFLEIGCGTGALAFLLLARDAAASGVAVELQPRLARLAARGCAENGFDGRLQVLEADARRRPWPAHAFDLVATNPPFRRLGAGVLPPDRERSIAHHELTLSLDEWLDAAESALGPSGRLAVIFAADRAESLVAGLARRGFGAVRSRAVLPRPHAPPRRLLLEAVRGGGAARITESPLVVHDGAGYSPEVRRMLEEE